MTLRSGLRNNRANNTGAALVGGIGDFLQNYAKSKQSRMAIDLDAKQQEISKARSEEDAKANRAIEDYRKKQTILDESKLNFEMGKSSAAAMAKSDNYARLDMLIDSIPDMKESNRKAMRSALKVVGPTSSVEDQNKAVLDWIKENYKPEKAEGVERGKGGLTRSESLSAANTITDNEMTSYKTQASQLNAQMENPPLGAGPEYGKDIQSKLESLKTNVFPNQRFENPTALPDSLYNAIPRLAKARATIGAGLSVTSSSGKPVTTPAQDLSQVEPAYGGQDQTNAQAIGWLQKVAASGKTIDDVMADYKANQATYQAKGITEEMIYDVLGKAQ